MVLERIMTVRLSHALKFAFEDKYDNHKKLDTSLKAKSRLVTSLTVKPFVSLT